MARRLVLTGKIFGKWTVVSRNASTGYWLCRCECGETNEIPVSNLTEGRSTMCKYCGHAGDRNGRRQWAVRLNGGPIRRDGVEYWQAASIKQRCIKDSIPFGFATLSKCADWIEQNTPEFCPVLGTQLARGEWRNGFRDCSPSVDRKIPALGYVPGNMQIMSQKANTMKNNATPDELRHFARWVLRGQ